MERIRAPHLVLMAATLALGLAADAGRGLAAQLAISAVFWTVLIGVLHVVEARERRALLVCLAIATAAELFLSLAWGLYRYRLDNVPLFVPPGHVMMFLLGVALARRMPARAATVIFAMAALYALGAAVSGLDTLGLALFALLAAGWIMLPRERRLFASTFVLTLGLELYGTWLGTWAWRREVPFTPMVSTNPPLLGGALYCTLDALVAVYAARSAPAAEQRSYADEQRQQKEVSQREAAVGLGP